MDFIKLIENNACLKAYFTKFPKKLKQLAVEGKIIKFCENKIEIPDLEQLGNYLASEASILPIKSVMDFFETLNVLKFSKCCNLKNKISYFFVHPNFDEDKAISDDFYKQAVDVSSKELKGIKHMSPMHHIELFDRLIRMNNSKKVSISRLQFARLRLQYVLQRKIDLMKYEQDIIDHNIEEPNYRKNNEIAGYYGDVEIDTLKKVFRNYFPIYQNVEEPMEVDQPATVIDQVVEPPVDPKDQLSQEIIVDVCSIPKIHKNKEQKQFEADDDENKENQPPPKKRRKNRTRNGKISMKETNEALNFLQKEVSDMPSDI